MTFSVTRTRRTMVVQSLVLCLSLLALSDCAPGELKAGLGPNESPPDVTAIAVIPAQSSIGVGDTVLVRATALTSTGQPSEAQVDWTASGGTLVVLTDSTARFSATSAGNYRIRGRYRKTPNPVDSATITVTAIPVVLQAVILTPATVALATGGTQQFSVSGQWSNGATTAPSVTYSATGGTISTGGLYTAGSTAGSFRVIATQQGGTLADTSTVTLTVTPPVLQAVILTPASASLATGGTQQFSVSGQWSNGATTAPSVTYSATGGTISASGLYVAGGSAGTFRVIAVANSGSLADTSTVTVTPTLAGCTLSPAAVTLNPGQSRQFSTIGNLTNGGTTAVQVTYSATGGTVTSSGLYTAGTVTGKFTIVAAVVGSAISCSASPEIAGLAPPPVLTAVVVSPVSTILASGASTAFTAVGQMSDSTTSSVTVNWSATGGTVSTGGVYTAGTTAGSFRVIATQQGGTLADTSSVTVTTSPPVLQAVILTPSNASLATGGTQQFSVSGQWSNGATTAPSVTYSATGGTISTGGLYTAGTTAGTFRVIATQQGGTLADTSSMTVSGPGQPGNLVSWDFEDGTFGPFRNGTGGATFNNWKIGTANCYKGSARCAEIDLPGSGSDTGESFWYLGSNRNDIWVKFSIRWITVPTFIQKVSIVRESGYGEQELYLVAYQGRYHMTFNSNAPDPVFGTVAADGWHTVKYHYDQTGAHPRATYWLDGVQVYDGYDTGIKPAISYVSFGGVLNANSGPSHFQIDAIEIGTVDMGW